MLKRYPKGLVAVVSLLALLLAAGSLYSQSSKLLAKQAKRVELAAAGSCDMAGAGESCGGQSMCGAEAAAFACAECAKAGKQGPCAECLSEGLDLSAAEEKTLTEAVDGYEKSVAAAKTMLVAKVKTSFKGEKADKLVASLAKLNQPKQPMAASMPGCGGGGGECASESMSMAKCPAMKGEASKPAESKKPATEDSDD